MGDFSGGALVRRESRVGGIISEHPWLHIGCTLRPHPSLRRCVCEREATPNPLRRARNILVSDLSDLPLPLNSSESHFCNPAQPSPAPLCSCS